MTLALVIMLLALAAFAVITVRRTASDDQSESALQARDQLRGFVYVGSAAALLLTVVVMIISISGPGRWWTDILAVLGFFGYCLYLVVAFVLHRHATNVPTAGSRPRHERR